MNPTLQSLCSGCADKPRCRAIVDTFEIRDIFLTAYISERRYGQFQGGEVRGIFDGSLPFNGCEGS